MSKLNTSTGCVHITFVLITKKFYFQKHIPNHILHGRIQKVLSEWVHFLVDEKREVIQLPLKVVH